MWQLQIHQDHVRSELADERDRLLACRGGSHNREVGLAAKHADEPLPDYSMIVHAKNSNGRAGRTHGSLLRSQGDNHLDQGTVAE